MRSRFVPFAAIAAISTALLAGCVTSFTASADVVATTAEDALEQSVGSRPDIDCGTEDFEVKENESRTCTLTDPANGDQYDAEVTIVDVNGAEFSVNVQVADAPK